MVLSVRITPGSASEETVTALERIAPSVDCTRTIRSRRSFVGTKLTVAMPSSPVTACGMPSTSGS